MKYSTTAKTEAETLSDSIKNKDRIIVMNGKDVNLHIVVNGKDVVFQQERGVEEKAEDDSQFEESMETFNDIFCYTMLIIIILSIVGLLYSFL